MTVRRIALGLVVAALVAVSALGVVAAVVERGSARHETRHETQVDAPLRSSRGQAPAGWQRVATGRASYVVPPGWSRRPPGERVAYREGGVVIASGRGYAAGHAEGPEVSSATRSAAECPVAWAVLADPVRSSNAAGLAKATALAWARGYAGLPTSALPSVTVDGPRARVEVPLGEGAPGCAGEWAELTAVAQPVGDAVVALVVARYLDVPGGLSDAAYDGVVGSFTAAQSE